MQVSTSSVFLLLLTLASSSVTGQNSSQETILLSLERPNDPDSVSRAIPALSASTDPNAILWMRTLFERTTLKEARQKLSVLLMKRGQGDDIFFEELAKYAQEATTSDAPMPYFTDQAGNAIRGPLPVAFVNWCQERRLEQEDCSRKVLGYAVDVYYLANVRDRRAISIFRQGLESTNEAVVDSCVLGLSELRDNDSIPLIAARIRRAKPTGKPILAGMLSRFDDARVAPLLDEFVRDPEWRKEIEDSIRKRHLEQK